MKLIFTLSNGQTFEVTKIEIGEQITVTYKDKDGKPVIRYIIVTPNNKLVMT